MEQTTAGAELWFKILGAAVALPGVKVDRAEFLRSNLQKHADEEQVSRAIQTNPSMAGISYEIVDQLADACRNGHVIKASALSFGAGVPGGWALAATIPVDIAQFNWHALVLAQKLAYLYGWQSILDDDGAVDEQTKYHLTLLIGVMMASEEAARGIAELSKYFARVVIRSPRAGFIKTGLWRLVGAEIAGISKAAFGRSVAKIIPVIGGLVSAGVTAVLLTPMANRLKDHLRELCVSRDQR